MYKKSIYLFLIIILYNCDSSNYKSFKNGWNSNENVKFTFILNELIPHDVFINVRNNSDYKFSNIFLIAKLKDSINLIYQDTLEYQMADANGFWLGKGFTNIKESKLWWKEQWRPIHNGPFFIEIVQSMRKNGSINKVPNLEGIVDVGFSIIPDKNQK